MGHNGCDGSQASGPWAIGPGYRFTGARRRHVVPRRVTLMSVLVSGPGPTRWGDPDVLALGVLTGSPEYEVYSGLVAAVAWGG